MTIPMVRRECYPLIVAVVLMLASMGLEVRAQTTTPPTAPVLTLPAEVKGLAGAFISVPAQTTGKTVAWLSLSDQLQLFPVELLKDTKTAVVVSAVPGSYKLIAVTAVADEVSPIATCVITIGGPTPPPGPSPPPGPTDPFSQSVATAYAADTDTRKLEYKNDLAQLYRVASAATANDTSITTTTQLLAQLQKARAAVMPDSALLGVRKLIETELNRTLAVPFTLTVETRAEVGKTLLRIALAVEAAK